MFLNPFFVLAKKAKFDDQHVLDLLYEKLRDEFKGLLVTMEKQNEPRRPNQDASKHGCQHEDH